MPGSTLPCYTQGASLFETTSLWLEGHKKTLCFWLKYPLIFIKCKIFCSSGILYGNPTDKMNKRGIALTEEGQLLGNLEPYLLGSPSAQWQDRGSCVRVYQPTLKTTHSSNPRFTIEDTEVQKCFVTCLLFQQKIKSWLGYIRVVYSSSFWWGVG